jgi:hypothetical protein
MYKIKQATNQLGRFNANHADNEVRYTLFPLILMATHHAKTFLKDLSTNAVTQEAKDGVKELLAVQKVHVDDLLGYEPSLTKKDEYSE